MDDYPLEGVCAGCGRVVAFVRRVAPLSPIRSADAINTDGTPISRSAAVCSCRGAYFCLRERLDGRWLVPNEATERINRMEREGGRRLLR